MKGRYWKHTALAATSLLLGSVVARAYDTNWITSGQPISAAKLKADLDEAQSRLAALEGRITNWQSYSPMLEDSTGNSAAALAAAFTTTGMYRRVGDSLEVRIYSVVTGPLPANDTSVRWTLPSGFAMDTTKLPSASLGRNIIGNAAFGRPGNNPFYSGSVDPGESNRTVSVILAGASYALSTGNTDMISNSPILIEFSVPVTP